MTTYLPFLQIQQGLTLRVGGKSFLFLVTPVSQGVRGGIGWNFRQVVGRPRLGQQRHIPPYGGRRSLGDFLPQRFRELGVPIGLTKVALECDRPGNCHPAPTIVGSDTLVQRSKATELSESSVSDIGIRFCSIDSQKPRFEIPNSLECRKGRR